ncbi:hypothetical protein [Streptomyces sp. NPDC005385]|uniref:hypothetical protein n=1 Tax=Streptomyces sp. NPDC005385 TaxID=3157039 RepID=UPI0033B9B55D
MTRNNLTKYLEDTASTASREALWDAVQFDSFDFESLAGVPLEDLQFVCARIEAHRMGDMYARLNQTEDGTEDDE